MMTQLALETRELLTGSIKQGKKETANVWLHMKISWIKYKKIHIVTFLKMSKEKTVSESRRMRSYPSEFMRPLHSLILLPHCHCLQYMSHINLWYFKYPLKIIISPFWPSNSWNSLTPEILSSTLPWPLGLMVMP